MEMRSTRSSSSITTRIYTLLVWCCLTTLLLLLLNHSSVEGRRFQLGNGTLVNGAPFYGFLLDQQPFYGVGINYFDGFWRYLLNGNDYSWKAGIDTLKANNIPFIRFLGIGFWGPDWISSYLKDNATQELYFAKLTNFTDYAHAAGIGLIPSLFFSYHGLSQVYGEPISAWGLRNSQTRQSFRNITQTIVSRFKDHPGIYGWELYNEANGFIDLPANYKYLIGSSSSRLTGVDTTFRVTILETVREYGEVIHAIDPTIVVFSGGNIAAPYSYSINYSGQWVNDLRTEQIAFQMKRDNPGLGTLTIHLYRYSLDPFTKLNGATPTYEMVLNSCMKESIRSKQPFWLGEWGTSKLVANWTSDFYTFIGTIERLRVPMSSLWVFDFPAQDADWNVNANNAKTFQLDAVRQLNLNMSTWIPNPITGQ